MPLRKKKWKEEENRGRDVFHLIKLLCALNVITIYKRSGLQYMLKNPVLYPFKPACIKNLGCARPVLGTWIYNSGQGSFPYSKEESRLVGEFKK